jgi:uncharacterized membrane protein YfcA
MIPGLVGHDLTALTLGAAAGLACGLLNTMASSGSAVSLPILMMIGLDPVTANASNRVPVLVAAISATASFHRGGHLDWALLARVVLPVTGGAAVGAVLAEIVPGRYLALLITAAVFIAFVLLFTRLKQAIERAQTHAVRLGTRELLLFFGIGVWLGFIVLDGGTYLLLALVIVVGLSLVKANALKSAILVPTTVVALAVFAVKGAIDWEIGAVMGAGSIVGGWLGARWAASPGGRAWVFRLLVLVIASELVHLVLHYVFRTT